MAEPTAYQPRSMFAQMLQQRQGERTQALVARTLNEEIEAGIGDQTNVNLAETLPQAYFSAARRIAALGNATEAQQLYSAGVQAIEATQKHQATLDNLRASTENLNESPTEYLEALRKRDELAAQLPNFAEGTPTGDAMRKTVNDLNARLERLNAAPGVGQLPRDIQMLEKINADRARMGQPPLSAEEFWRTEMQTSTRAQDYREYVEGGGKLPFEQWSTQFGSRLAAGSTLGEQGIKNLFEQETTARDAVSSLNSIQASLDLLNEGVRTGTGADIRQYVARAAATFLGDDPSQATVNTDAYIATSAPRVVQIVRALAPVTDQDKEYIQAAVGGNLSTATPEAMRKLLEIAARAQSRNVERFNDRLSKLGAAYQDVSGVFEPIEAPEINFGAPAAAAPRVRIRVDANGNVIP